jgi:hypothetical protein
MILICGGKVMRTWITAVLLVLAPVVYGHAGDAIYAQSYSNASVGGGTSYASVADEFTPLFTGSFQYAVIYQYFKTTPPSVVFLKITRDSGDTDPNNATVLLSGNFSVSYTATGDSLSGKPIYKMMLDLGQSVEVASDSLYWLETGVVFGSYVLYQDTLVSTSPMWYFDGGQYHCFSEQSHNWDSFFELRTADALMRNSWGAVKTSL